MKAFEEYIEERVLSIGLNPKHEKFRTSHEREIHDAIQKSYSTVHGGYGGHGSGSKKESEAILADIRNKDHIIKATRRDGKVDSAVIYKRSHGRKIIALGSTGTTQGKKDLSKTVDDDKRPERNAWGELSDRAENYYRKKGYKVQPSSKAKKLTGKDDVEVQDDERYTRKIGGERHSKVIMGNPKDKD